MKLKVEVKNSLILVNMSDDILYYEIVVKKSHTTFMVRFNTFYFVAS